MVHPLTPESLSSLSIREITGLLETADIDSLPSTTLIETLRTDPRAGVRALAARFERQKERRDRQRERELSLTSMERELAGEGYAAIVGVDEAGRGPLAGPVVAAAVILPADCDLTGVDDSKKLTPARREALYERITTVAASWGVGMAEHDEIDEVGILEASMSAMRAAVKNLGVTPDIALIDGNRSPGLIVRERLVVGGDGRCRNIAAASIVAKVTRDRIMEEMDRRYNGYGFAGHKGYGTGVHVEAIRRLGPCDIHRLSFKIVPGVSPPGTCAEVLERRLANAPTRVSFERAVTGIARMREFLRESEVERLRDCFRSHRRKFGSVRT